MGPADFLDALDINEKTIQLFREKNINDLPDRLFNNIVNGIKLSGFFKIR